MQLCTEDILMWLEEKKQQAQRDPVLKEEHHKLMKWCKELQQCEEELQQCEEEPKQRIFDNDAREGRYTADDG